MKVVGELGGLVGRRKSGRSRRRVRGNDGRRRQNITNERACSSISGVVSVVDVSIASTEIVAGGRQREVIARVSTGSIDSISIVAIIGSSYNGREEVVVGAVVVLVVIVVDVVIDEHEGT